MSLVNMIKGFEDYIGSNGRPNEDIERVEIALGLCFASDYREYLKEIGLACFNGHEMTGITNIARVDVEKVTKEQREQNTAVPSDWYVVEEANVDGVVIWQSATGEVFQTAPGSTATKIANNLTEYIS